MSDYLIERIVEVTRSPHSRNFYQNVIKVLGEGLVEMELGELKYQIRVGNVKHPGKYFTKLLQDQLSRYGEQARKIIPKDTYQELSQQDLFRHLQPRVIPKPSLKKEKKMPQPYFPGQIPFPTFIGQEFFTLSKNKKRSDTVKYTSTTADGKQLQVSLIRGKSRPGSKSWGIPTVQHGKLFTALIKAWTDSKSNYMEHDEGTLVCFVRISAQELADYLGWKEFGGKNIEMLNNRIAELSSFPYYYNLENLNIGLKGFGFKLLGDYRIIDIENKYTKGTIFEIMFSTTVSWQLLNRHSITKPDELISIRNEIGWKLRMYLEPRLMSISDNQYSINLENLTYELQLPKAKWHKYKSQRKKIFSQAVKELNNSAVADGRIMKLGIILNKDKSDYKLTAYLENPRQRLALS